MYPPRLIQISALDVVPEPALLARLHAAERLPERSRRTLAVMLRDPELTGRALLRLGAALREATRAIGASLLVNDRLDLALSLGADGVHLGRRSVSIKDARALLGAGAFVSRSCHAVDDVGQAAGEGADAAILSPIFASPDKGPPLGLHALTLARAALDRGGFERVALVALGGIDAGNTEACFSAGAGAVAAIRADLFASLDAPPRSC
jgi:thiamine-phosphate pyrophosphorylase